LQKKSNNKKQKGGSNKMAMNEEATQGTAVRAVAKTIELDKVKGNVLTRILFKDGGDQYLIVEDDGIVKIEAEKLETIMKHWKTIHTKEHNKWRNGHFRSIIKRVDEMKERENDNQLPLIGDDDSDDEE
jgi:hypothetical protein